MGTEPFDRKLAAILYADVAGYSRLTGEDEEGTHRILSACLDSIAATIEEHGGKVMHYAGDAVLADFNTASIALACAVAIQKNIEVCNQGIPENRKVRFRIGVNLGEVIVDRNEIFGDGVNIAARLESLAEPGGICISQALRSAVGEKLPLDYDFLGEQHVKNIAQPVQAYHARLKPDSTIPLPDRRSRGFGGKRRIALVAIIAILIAATAVTATRLMTSSLASRDAALPIPKSPTIAVLPFENIGGEKSEEYFADGMTNDIITDLSKFSDLLVIASNTMFTYKGRAVDVQNVSRDLGVRYVLEGSVQRINNRLRINAQLIDGTTGHHLWAQRYDRFLEDVFALQNEIVQTIVTKLALKVSAVERERAFRKDTEDLESYDYVLRGREFLARTTRAANMEARRMFKKAIERDPRYASAYAGLGWTYRKAVGHGWTESPNEALQRAHDLAQKALSFKPNVDAYRLLGYVHLALGQHDLANDALERAIELNPNDWASHEMMGSVLLYSGYTEEAIEKFETTLRFNPVMDVDRLFELGLAYYLEGKLTESIRTLEQGLGRNPDNPFLHIAVAAAYASAERVEDAERAAAAVRRLHPFFRAESFGSRFKDPKDRESIAAGLRKAGLS